jgi:hypothetical protein
MTRPAVPSVLRFRWGKQTLYVVPLRSLWYGAVSLGIVLAVLVLIDRVMLGSLERSGWTSGQLWQRHNQLVELNHRRKTTTNECELRHWNGEPQPDLSAAQRARTILVVGDSFIWGPPYITLNHLWWRQLAVELERRGYRDVQIVASGHPGMSTRRELECARGHLPAVRPDLIVWGYVTNDPDEKLVRQIFDSQDDSPIPQRIRVRLKWLLPNLMFKFESLRADNLAAHYAGPNYGYRYADWELKLLEGENLERYRQTVADAGTFLKQSQTPAFLQTLPVWPSGGHYEPRYALVLPLWREAGIPVNDTLVEFIRRYGNAPASGPQAIAWGINPADSHPGPRATRFHAVMAADYLEQHHAEVIGPKDFTRPHELVINDWLPFDLNVRPEAPSLTRRVTLLLDYPATTEFMPVLPLDEPTALVALRYPLPLERIELAGGGLSGARIWISTLHPEEQYDQCQWRELPRASGSDLSFAIPPDLAGQAVTMIRFAADVAGQQRELRMTLHQAAGEQP